MNDVHASGPPSSPASVGSADSLVDGIVVDIALTALSDTSTCISRPANLAICHDAAMKSVERPSTIGVVGLGYVGLPLVVALVEAGTAGMRRPGMTGARCELGRKL